LAIYETLYLISFETYIFQSFQVAELVPNPPSKSLKFLRIEDADQKYLLLIIPEYPIIDTKEKTASSSEDKEAAVNSPI
jgi:hypothetical protein